MATCLSNSIRILEIVRHHWIWLVIAFVFIVAYILVSVYFEIVDAKVEISKRPKEAMEWCPKHGPIRKQHCLQLFPGMKKSNGEEWLQCPICYKESVFDNPNARLS